MEFSVELLSKVQGPWSLVARRVWGAGVYASICQEEGPSLSDWGSRAASFLSLSPGLRVTPRGSLVER